MAVDKYLKNVLGQVSEVSATAVSTGVTEANKIVALGTDGKLDSSVMPTGIGADTSVLSASEALSAGDIVNIYNAAGTAKCRKADCSNGRRAHGFVLAVVAQDADATVYKDSTITGLTIAAADVGIPYYLSTGGAFSKTAPTTSGYISQEVGYSVSASEIAFEPQQPITLA